MVFYLKYRPSQIKDLDSQDVRERLTKILSSDNVPHAFLFTGPKGLGKTSAARIVAKSVNCTKRKEGEAEPCGKCDSCLSITNGTNLDVMEIDGASNRGIDEIRDLREKIRLAPTHSKKKVYIIDEVHMLTTEAFNALLKTLEEPPPHAMFVLCTTEPHKVPATIVSRCLHVTFSTPSSDEMKRSFQRIAKGEGLIINDEGYDAILKLSDSSFRDGAKILDEIAVNFGKEKVGKEEIEKSFHVTEVNQSIKDLIKYLNQKDIKKGLELIESLAKQKTDLKYFSENLLSYLHSLLLSKYGVTTNKDLDKFLSDTNISDQDLKKLIEAFSKSHSQLKMAVSPQIPFEIAIIEFCVDSKDSIPALVAKEKKEEIVVAKAVEVQSDLSDEEKILSSLIEKVNSENKSAAALLRGVKFGKEGPDKVVFITSYKFHKERLDDPKVKELIEKMYKELTGKNKKVEIDLGGDK